MGNEIQKAFEIKGMTVPVDSKGRVNLTSLWIAAGRPKSKNPDFWLKNASTREFISSLAAKSRSGIPDLLHKVNGNVPSRGTWGHWQIALAYAKWLSPEFHQYVNEGFRQWQEEEKDPGLKIDRALDRWRQLGKEEEWIKTRFDGQLQRKALCNTLSDHNCRPTERENPYAEITNSGNLAVLGKTAKEYREAKGLAKTVATRDHMQRHELAGLNFFEAMTEKRVKDTAADGNAQCVACAKEVGTVVKQAMRSLDVRK